MSQYLYIGTYTKDGRSGLVAEGGTARERETRKLFESLGGEVVHYSFAIGAFDFIIIAEVADDVTALVPPMLASTTGTVDVTTTKLLSSEEVDQVATKVREASFRAAGTS